MNNHSSKYIIFVAWTLNSIWTPKISKVRSMALKIGLFIRQNWKVPDNGNQILGDTLYTIELLTFIIVQQ